MERIHFRENFHREVYMKYTKEERLKIGEQIYEGSLTVTEAAEKYEINQYTARDYLRMYKAKSGLKSADHYSQPRTSEPISIEEYREMTKEELIDELIRAKVDAARAKKGYEVKGAGQKREFVIINNKSMK